MCGTTSPEFAMRDKNIENFLHSVLQDSDWVSLGIFELSEFI